MYSIIEKDKINENIISTIAQDYQYPKRSRNGKIQFNTFAHELGNNKTTYLSSEIGHIKIKVRSQFEKMLHSKDSRASLLFCIKDTIKNPLFILKDSDTDNKVSGYYFVNALKKRNDKLFYMVSICKKVDEGELALMTSYQIRNLGKFKNLLNNKEVLFSHEQLNSVVKISSNANIKEEGREQKEICLNDVFRHSLPDENENSILNDEARSFENIGEISNDEVMLDNISP